MGIDSGQYFLMVSLSRWFSRGAIPRSSHEQVKESYNGLGWTEPTYVARGERPTKIG